MLIKLKQIPFLNKYASELVIIDESLVKDYHIKNIVEYRLYKGSSTKTLQPLTTKAQDKILDYLNQAKTNKQFTIVKQDITVIKAIAKNLNLLPDNIKLQCDAFDNPVIYCQIENQNLILFNRIPNLQDYLPTFIQRHITVFNLKYLDIIIPYDQEHETLHIGIKRQEKRSILAYKYRPLPDPIKMQDIIKAYPYKQSYNPSYSHLLELYQYQSLNYDTVLAYIQSQKAVAIIDKVTNKLAYLLTRENNSPIKLQPILDSLPCKYHKVTYESQDTEIEPDKGYDFEYDKTITLVEGSKFAKLRADMRKIAENKIPDLSISFIDKSGITQDTIKDLNTLKTVWSADFFARTKTRVVDEFFPLNYLPFMTESLINLCLGFILEVRYKDELTAYIISTYASSKDIYHAEHTYMPIDNPYLTRLNKIMVIYEYNKWLETMQDFNFRTGFSHNSLAQFKKSLNPIRVVKYK